LSTLAISLVLLSTILHATRDFLTKRSEDKQIFIWWCTVLSLILTFPVFVYLLITGSQLSLAGVLIALGVSIVHFFYWLFYSKAYDAGDLSEVYPIIRSAPALVLLLAVVFLNEKVSTFGVMGILLVSAGVYGINLKGFSPKALLKPVTSFPKNRQVQFAFLALITVAIYSIVDKIGVSYLHPIIYAFILAFSTTILFGIYLFKTKNHTAIKNAWKENKKTIFLNSIVGSLNYPLILVALTLSKVSYVVGLRQISVIFAVLMGGHLLKEKNKAMRLAASMLIFAGAICIAVA
jgi:uncharacterized membrane protein